MPDTIDLSSQPRWPDYDRSVMPQVEEGLLGIRTAVVAWIGRLQAGVEMYAPVPDIDQGGTLELTQTQTRHLYAKLGELIHKWDTEPRDLGQEVDKILSTAAGRRFTSRTRASQGYETEVETDGANAYVFVYHHDGRERIGDDSPHLRYLYVYAEILKGAGYTGVEVQAASHEHAARVHAIPPAAESF
jgi:hypothetical protein